MKNSRNLSKDDVYVFSEIEDIYKPVLDLVGDAQFVLLGESTHGTHEFYEIRAGLTKQLIKKKHFNTIAIEGDWPDTYRINRFIMDDKKIKSVTDSLEGFKRFPTWVWRNKVIEAFLKWIHSYNHKLEETKRIGFYGLDLYSLNTSIGVVINYLKQVDKEAAIRAIERYSCFDHFKEELQSYGYANALGITRSCEDEVIRQLIDLHKNSYKYLKENGIKQEEFFNAQQNARLIKNAEKYYRSMFGDQALSWNIRDTHMAETLDTLVKHITKTTGRLTKIVVWAHNSHIGDARATEIGKNRSEVNLGQLAREKYGSKVVLIGFLTYSGTVTAATQWDSVAERKYVRPALSGSYEDYFHRLNIPNFFINLQSYKHSSDIPDNNLERAIGVIYRPQTERASHYFFSSIKEQFDGVIYMDKTRALEPLERTAIWHHGEVFETFPSGL